jgi:hypothetical protein
LVLAARIFESNDSGYEGGVGRIDKLVLKKSKLRKNQDARISKKNRGIGKN